MNKTTKKMSMRAAMLLLAVLCCFTGSKAQEVTIDGGGGTSGNPYLPCYSYYSLSQQIYTAQEINTSGTISYICVRNTGGKTTRYLSIYMLQTSKSAFSKGTDWVAMDNGNIVYDGEVSFIADGWTTIFLDQPFEYDGSSNLLVGVADYTGSHALYNSMKCLVFSTTASQAICYFSDEPFSVSSPGVAGTVLNVKNQIVLGFGDSCPKPGLSVAGVTSNSATLTWDGGSGTYNVQFRQADEDWSKLLVATQASSYTLTGLSMSTAYEARVQSIGDGDTTSDWYAVSFTTTVVETEVGSGWSDGFEGTSCNWNLINGSCLSKWYWGTAVSHGGTRSLYISSDGGASNDYANQANTTVFATKLFHFSEGNYTFSYDWRANGETSMQPKDYLRVALIPGSQTLVAGGQYNLYYTLPSGWIPLDGGASNKVSSWTNKTATAKVSGTYYLAFIWVNDGSGKYSPAAAVDNVSISRQSCPYTVQGLTAVCSSETEASLSWTAGEASLWQVSYSTSSSFTSETLVMANDPSYTITGLTAGTTYYARVRSCCSSDDFGAWSNMVSFVPTAKLKVGSGTATTGVLPTYVSGYYSMSQQIYTAAELGSAGTILSIDFNNTSAQVSRYLDIYMVNTSKSTFGSKTDWVSVTNDDLVYSGTVTFLQNAWTTIQLNKSFAYSGKNVVLVVHDKQGDLGSTTQFLSFSATNQALYINSSNKNLNFDPTSPSSYSGYLNSRKNQILLFKRELPLTPTKLTVSSTGTTAQIRWTENSGASQWKVAYRPAGTTNFTEVTANTNPCTLTDLDLATDYEVKVRSVKGDEMSEWTAATQFATDLCDEENMCVINITLTDARKDGWNGNKLYVVDALTNTTIDSFTLESGGSGTFILNACHGRAINFVYEGISYQYENGYRITDANDNVICEHTGCRSSGACTPPTEGVIATYTVSCIIPWKEPTALSASEEGPYSVKLAWTENSVPAATSWVVAYKAADAQDFSETVADSNPFTLTGLTGNTQYMVKVRPANDDEVIVWSDAITFTTLLPIFPPTELTASDVTHDEATLSWTENSQPAATSWVVGYKADGDVNFTEVTVDKNPFKLEKLASETLYTVIVRPANDDVIKWSDEITFTTISPIYPPTGLKATKISYNYIKLAWTENSVPPATSWVIAYKADSDEDFTEVDADSNPFTVRGLTGDTQYTLKVRPVNEAGTIKWSDEITVTTSSPIFAPSDLTAADVTHDAATLSWTENSHPKEKKWVVAYKADGDEDYTEIDTESNPFTLTGLEYGTHYTVKVRPFNDATARKWSDDVTFTTLRPILPPTDLTAIDITHKEVTLSWTENSTPAATSWVVAYKADSEEDFTEVVADDNTITLGALAGETQYAVKVRPVNDYDIIQWCDEITFTTLSPIYPPTELSATDVTTSSVNLSWTENSDPKATKWRVYYKAEGEEEFIEVTTPKNPCTLAGLDPETKYVVKVSPFTDDVSLSKWSKEVEFTTLPRPLAPPADLAVTDITTDAATVTWTGDFESYDIRLKALKRPDESALEQVDVIQTATAVLTECTFDLTGYSGKGWIAIRHCNATNQGQLIIDDIKLTNSKGEIVLTENFEDNGMPRWHNFNNYGNPSVWTVIANSNDDQNNPYGHDNSYAKSTSSLDDDQPSDNWLIIVPDQELGGTLTLYARSAGSSDEMFGVYVAMTTPVIPETTTTIEYATSPYLLSELASGSAYNVEVKGYSGIKESEWSAPVTFTTKTDGDNYLLGDVNGDGSITPADAIMILYHYFGVEQTGFIEAAADVNGDQGISPADAIEALYLYFGGNTSNGARATRATKTEDDGCEPE